RSFPTRRSSGLDCVALSLANYLLGQSETSRLWNRVRVKEGLSYDVRSALSASAYEPNGSWTIHAIFAPENAQRVQAVIREELDNRSEEHTSELQSRFDLVCRLLLEKKK